MQPGERMTVVDWIVLSLYETVAEALFFSILLTALEWRNLWVPGQSAYELVSETIVVAFFLLFLLFLTGYMLTTAAFRVLWKSKNLWSYPTIATVLFFLHFEFFSHSLGGAFDPRVRLGFRTGGALIVFVCTFTGGYLLRRRSMSEGSGN